MVRPKLVAILLLAVCNSMDTQLVFFYPSGEELLSRTLSHEQVMQLNSKFDLEDLAELLDDDEIKALGRSDRSANLVLINEGERYKWFSVVKDNRLAGDYIILQASFDQQTNELSLYHDTMEGGEEHPIAHWASKYPDLIFVVTDVTPLESWLMIIISGMCVGVLVRENLEALRNGLCSSLRDVLMMCEPKISHMSTVPLFATRLGQVRFFYTPIDILRYGAEGVILKALRYMRS